MAELIDETIFIIGLAGYAPAVNEDMNFGCKCGFITQFLPNFLDPLNMVPLTAVRRAEFCEKFIKPQVDFLPISSDPALTVVAMFV